MSDGRRTTLLRIAAFLIVVIIGAIALVYRHQIRQLSEWGYLGAFLLPMLANATVFVPIPGVMVIFTMGGLFNPFLVAILGGMGAATGELTGYLVGFSGQGLAEHVKYYDRIHNWMASHPRRTDLMIAVFAMIPNPFFDAAGIAAGTLKVPIWRFLLFCMTGSIIKMMAFALVGSSSINWFLGPPGP